MRRSAVECLACAPTVSDVSSAGDVGALEEKLKVRAPSEDNLSIVALCGTFCVDGGRLRALHAVCVNSMRIDDTITVATQAGRNRSQACGHQLAVCCGSWPGVVRCTVWCNAI